MVPCKPAAKSITLAPGVALAAATAARRDPGPLSLRFRTVKGLSRLRSSSPSRLRCLAGARRLVLTRRRVREVESKRIVRLLSEGGPQENKNGHRCGARTERRSVARPVRHPRGGVDAPGPCPTASSVPLFGVRLPPIGLGLADCRLAIVQQFWRMYVPSMLAVMPFNPDLSVLLMVLATVKESM